MGVAGHNADLYITGTSTGMTDEACTEVSGTVFQVTDSAKRILDHDVSIVVEANSVAQSGNYTIDTLFGIVTFTDGSHTGETITVTANYLPRHQVAQIRSETFNSAWKTGDSTAQQDAGQDLTLVQRQVSVTVDAIQLLDTVYDGGTESLDDTFDAGTVVVIEFQPTGSSNNVWRARSTIGSLGITSSVGDLAGASLEFVPSSRGADLVSVNTI